MKNNIVCWFEIPVTDMDRAVAFYSKVFDVDVKIEDFEGTKMAWFPADDKKPGASGALIQQKSYLPSETHGPMLYFNSEEINNELKLVKENGGKVVQEKTLIAPEIGYMAVFVDTEGNRISLYSNP